MTTKTGKGGGRMLLGNLDRDISDLDIDRAIKSLGIKDLKWVNFPFCVNGCISPGYCTVYLNSQASISILLKKFPKLVLNGKTPTVSYDTEMDLIRLEALRNVDSDRLFMYAAEFRMNTKDPFEVVPLTLKLEPMNMNCNLLKPAFPQTCHFANVAPISYQRREELITKCTILKQKATAQAGNECANKQFEDALETVHVAILCMQRCPVANDYRCLAYIRKLQLAWTSIHQKRASIAAGDSPNTSNGPTYSDNYRTTDKRGDYVKRKWTREYPRSRSLSPVKNNVERKWAYETPRGRSRFREFSRKRYRDSKRQYDRVRYERYERYESARFRERYPWQRTGGDSFLNSNYSSTYRNNYRTNDRHSDFKDIKKDVERKWTYESSRDRSRYRKYSPKRFTDNKRHNYRERYERYESDRPGKRGDFRSRSHSPGRRRRI